MKRRTPVVRQMNACECGAACLAMILGHFGRRTRLEECRSVCDPGRDGITAQTIVLAARHFGLETKAFSFTSRSYDEIPVPSIIHWNQNHFVVLDRWSSSAVVLIDPDRGRRRVTASEFREYFSGTVLHLAPGPQFDARPQHLPNPLLEHFRQILRAPGTARILAEVIAASLVLQAFGFALPLVTKWLVDHVLPQGRTEQLNLLAMGAVLVAVMHSGVAWLRAALLIRLGTRLDSRLMRGFFEHLLALPFRFFQLRSSGDLLMRLSSNAIIREALASYTTSAILDGGLVVVFFIALLNLAPPFAAAAVVIALVEVAVALSSGRRLQSLVENDLACQSAAQSCMIESLMGISTLKASGAETATLARWSGLLDKQLESSAQRSLCFARVDSATVLIRTFAPLFLLWLGGTLVLQGSLSLGAMLAANGLAAVFLYPVSSLVMSAQRLQLAKAHLERISDVMHAAPEQDVSTVGPAPRLTGGFELRNVSFRYDTHSPDVLSNVSLRVYPGQKIALVGRTGSGKSTLAKLLLGLYIPGKGEITYDGVPLQSMNLQELRRQWGAALQDPFLFNSSLRENIAFHDSRITMPDLIAAARIAEIHSDIAQMPMGYETRVDEGGQCLSGGQRQRLAIARAIAGRPRLLLLDEATSHLDVVTESLVDRNLDTLPCTRVVIAHRLSTIRNADVILVLDGGRVVEQGSHHELLRQGGYYAALIRNQVEQSHTPPPCEQGGIPHILHQ